jgi:thiol-disulfide isomerase/thioredoxin
VLAFAVALTLLAVDGAATPGAELIGKPALAWEATDWINSPPLTLAGLRGKVVLVRWFTSTECPYCSATAPALNQLDNDYRAKGLVVVGMYHHKDDQHPLDVAKVRGWVASDYKFRFPVAVDRDWHTLHRWWLDGRKRDFTSVSFLIDRKGIIRRLHPGGAMVLGSRDYGEMRTAIERLLTE